MKIKILIIMIVTLILSACSANSAFVGRVNKNWIRQDEYMNQLRRSYETFLLEHNFTPDIQQRQSIAQEAWQNIVDGYIVRDLFIKYNITVSHREVLDTLRTNIPELIKNSPRFLNENKNFNFDLYFSSLTTDKPEDLSWLRQYYLTTYIPLKKLQDIVISERKISDKELRDFYNIRYSEADIELFLFSKESVDINSIIISDKETEEFYNKNKETFFIEPKIDFNWVLFSVSPSEKDKNTIKTLADSLYKDIHKGRNFGHIARDHSSQPYARLQGLAGFMEIDQFHKDIQTKLRNASVGDVIPPFLFENAWWILKVDEKTVNMAKLNIIKLDIKASKETLDNNKKNMERFLELSNRIGFSRTAEELQLQIYNQKNLSLKESYIQDIGDVENVIRRAMRLADKTILEPILIKDQEAYIVFQVDKKINGYYKNIYEVIDDIHEYLVINKKQESIIQQATNLRNNFNTSTSNNYQIKSLTVKYQNKSDFNYNFIVESLSNSENYLTNVFHNTDNAYFARILATRKIDNIPAFFSQKNILKTELQNLNRDDYFNQWLELQKKRAKVKDLRPTNSF